MRAIAVSSLALVLAVVATARGEYRVVTQRHVDWETSRSDATAPRACTIGDEIRPAAGCPSPVFLGIENGVEAPAGRVQRVYGLPGEDHLRLLDAQEAAGIVYVGARDENSAAIMAATELRSRGADVRGEVAEERWGRLTSIRLPGGGELGLYEPRHPIASH